MENLIKMDDLGVPLFSETSILVTVVQQAEQKPPPFYAKATRSG